MSCGRGPCAGTYRPARAVGLLAVVRPRRYGTGVIPVDCQGYDAKPTWLTQARSARLITIAVSHYREKTAVLMTKAVLDFPSGAKVLIEGTSDDVEQLIRKLTSDARSRDSASSTRRQRRGTAKHGGAVRDYVLELRDAGFFAKPQGLSAIRQALAAEAHLTPMTTLSGVMLGLVKSRELRRLKEEAIWTYVNR